MRKVSIALAIALFMGLLAMPAQAAEVTEPAPAGGTFVGQGTPLPTTQAGTSSCYSYTRGMRVNGGVWWANHDITWCVSGGLVRSISRGCNRYGAIYPWVRDGCYRGDALNLNRTSSYVRNGSWAYCAAVPVGCAFPGGFWTSIRVYANGGVTGSWGTW